MTLEIGKAYRTRGGYRAVIVDSDGNGFTVWHSKREETWSHYFDGRFACDEYDNNVAGFTDHRDILAPWREPREDNLEELHDILALASAAQPHDTEALQDSLINLIEYLIGRATVTVKENME